MNDSIIRGMVLRVDTARELLKKGEITFTAFQKEKDLLKAAIAGVK